LAIIGMLWGASHLLTSTSANRQWFLSDILTPQEIIEISDRIYICKALKKGKTQRVIAQEL